MEFPNVAVDICLCAAKMKRPKNDRISRPTLTSQKAFPSSLLPYCHFQEQYVTLQHFPGRQAHFWRGSNRAKEARQRDCRKKRHMSLALTKCRERGNNEFEAGSSMLEGVPGTGARGPGDSNYSEKPRIQLRLPSRTASARLRPVPMASN